MFGRKSEEILRLKVELNAQKIETRFYKSLFESRQKKLMEKECETIRLKFELQRLQDKLKDEG